MKVMKYRITKIFAAAAAFCAVLAGCSMKEENNSVSRKEVRFAASVGSFDVKATDTAFEEGDAMGVYASNYLFLDNARLNYTGGKVVPETPVFWNPDMMVEDQEVFRAYYPYMENPEFSDEYLFYAVGTDQSDEAVYKAADLMTAYTLGAPIDEAVRLNFVHRQSKVNIDVDVRVEGVEIAEVYVGNVTPYGWYIIENPNRWDWSHEVASIKAYPFKNAAGKTLWSVILPPQYVNPALILKATDGKQYSYESGETLRFWPGMRYTAKAVLDESSVSTNFQAEISDWWDAGEFEFGQKTFDYMAQEWSVIGQLRQYNNSWDRDLYMERVWAPAFSENGGECFYTELRYQDNDQFKFRMNYSWEMNYGFDGTWDKEYTAEDGVVYSLMEGGPNIRLEKSGIWDIFMDPQNALFKAVWKEELPAAVEGMVYRPTGPTSGWYNLPNPQNLGSNFTVQVKFWADDWDNEYNARLLSFYDSQERGLMLRVSGKNESFAQGTLQIWGSNQVVPDWYFTTKAWHVVTLTYDGAVLNVFDNEQTVYSGELELLRNNELNFEVLEMGLSWDDGGNYPEMMYFHGVLDYVRVWNRPLEKYELGLCNLETTEGLVDFWKMGAVTEDYIIPDLMGLNPIDLNSVTPNPMGDASYFSKDFANEYANNCYQWWGDLCDFSGGDPQPVDTWGIVGDIMNLGWSYDVTMNNEGGYYWADIEYYKGQQFKFRKNASWDYNLGLTEEYFNGFEVASYNEYPLMENGYNIAMEKSGLWRVYLNPDALYFKVECLKEYEDDPAATGNGSWEDPFNIAGAIQAVQRAGDQMTEGQYFVKGVISSIKYTYSAQYGTATFNISDDGSQDATQFTCYSIYYLENQPWVEGFMQIQEGDNVVVYGNLTKYKDTYETVNKQAYLYSLNGLTADPYVPVQIDNWGITGALSAYGLNWDGDIAMDWSSIDNKYYANLTYYVGEQFKFRKNGDWSENLGSSMTGITLDDLSTLSLAWNGDNISLSKSGIWNVALDMNNLTMTVVHLKDIEEDPEPEPEPEFMPTLIETTDGYAMEFGTELLAAYPVWDPNFTWGNVSYSNDSSYGSNTVTELRIYKGKNFIVTAKDGYELTSIEFECTAAGANKQGPGCWGSGAPEGYSWAEEESLGRWEGAASQVSFNATDNQVRIKHLVVSYRVVTK